jgi:hypothetical protein
MTASTTPGAFVSFTHSAMSVHSLSHGDGRVGQEQQFD